jgi:hypothetical protein
MGRAPRLWPNGASGFVMPSTKDGVRQCRPGVVERILPPHFYKPTDGKSQKAT